MRRERVYLRTDLISRGICFLLARREIDRRQNISDHWANDLIIHHVKTRALSRLSFRSFKRTRTHLINLNKEQKVDLSAQKCIIMSVMSFAKGGWKTVDDDATGDERKKNFPLHFA